MRTRFLRKLFSLTTVVSLLLSLSIPSAFAVSTIGTNITTGGTLTVDGASTLTGAVTITGASTLTGAVTLGTSSSITGASSGGAMTLAAGAGSATGTGGVVTLTSGAGGSTSGASGAVTIASGTTTSGVSGDVILKSGNPTGGASGSVTISSGNATSTNTVGGITIQTGSSVDAIIFPLALVGGSPSGTGDGGSVTVSSGTGGATGNTRPGDISLTAGNAGVASNRPGGSVTISSGAGGLTSGTGTGGTIQLNAGQGGATSGAGGAVSINGGNPGGGNSDSGGITLAVPAAAGTGSGGTITITAGNAAASNADTDAGDVSITAGTGGTAAFAGGDFTAAAGNGGAVAPAGPAGGTATFRGGTGGSSSANIGGTGGVATFAAGNGGAGNSGGVGGAATFRGGDGATGVDGGGGGASTLRGGDADATGTGGTGGNLTIRGGNAGVAGSGNTTGGDISITGGAGGGTGIPGDITISTGTEEGAAAAALILLDALNEGDNLRIIAGNNEATAIANGNDIEFQAEDDIIHSMTAAGQVVVDADTNNSTNVDGAVDINFESATTLVEGVNIFARTSSASDNDLISGLFIELDDDSSAATSGLYGIRIDSSDITGNAGVTGIYMDSGAPGVEIGMVLEDDLDLALGTPADVGGSGTARILWETADANANELIIALPAGDATDVPVLVIGDDSIVNADLTFFNGITDTTIGIVSADAGDYGRFIVDNSGHLTLDTVTAGSDIILTPVDDIILTVDEVQISGNILVTLDNEAGRDFALCVVADDGGATPGTTQQEIDDCDSAVTADYAEQYPVAAGVTYGDIVTTGTKVVFTEDKYIGKQQIVQMVKSSVAYQEPIVGIVSNNYADFTSAGYNIKAEDNPMPVALVGRVPVNVTNEGGSIKVGDFVTTSSTPGKAMKATRAGRVIGMALSDFNGVSGQVMVQVVNTFWAGPVDLDAKGTASIVPTQRKVRVDFTKEFVTGIPNVSVTPLSNPGSYFWVSEVSSKGFTINLEKYTASEVKFNWMVK